MNPLDNDVGILILFGISALVILVAAYRTRTSRYAIIVGTIGGMVCAMAVYTVIGLVALAAGGTGGYQLVTWLLIVGAGLLPAGALGLLEGFAASLIFRLLR